MLTLRMQLVQFVICPNILHKNKAIVSLPSVDEYLCSSFSLLAHPTNATKLTINIPTTKIFPLFSFYSPLLFISLKEVIRYLQNKYNISKIYGHRELNQTDCPGKNFPLSRIKKECLGESNSGVKSIRNAKENSNWCTSYPGYLLKYNPNRFDANVKVIQSKLQNIGYSVGRCGVDGYFGDGTLLAIKCFQRDCNLMIDGIVGRNTWDRIMRE